METLKHTIYACIILHNMIVEDERHTYGGEFDYSYDNADNNISIAETFHGPHPNLASRLKNSERFFHDFSNYPYNRKRQLKNSEIG
jgi:hypothetical protein